MLGLPAPFVPHSASLSPATATRVLSTTVPVSAPPTSLDKCLFSISLVSVPLAVRISVSSGCARRRSVSTYAAILVPPRKYSFKSQPSSHLVEMGSQSDNLTPELEPFVPLPTHWSLPTAWHRGRCKSLRHCLVVLSVILFSFSSSLSCSIKQQSFCLISKDL